MKPKPIEQDDLQMQLFNLELIDIIDPKHELVLLSQQISWNQLNEKFGCHYVEETGSPGKPTRLMAGLQYLKYTYNLSDETLLKRWIENPYWQYFCGGKYFEHKFPIHPTSLTKWRQRIGEKGVEILLSATVDTGVKCKAVHPRSFQKLNVDTTVQEKAVTHPTDAKLYESMRKQLVRMCNEFEVSLRQTYSRVSKRLLWESGRLFHARKFKKAKAKVKTLKTYLGRVTRDIERKIKKHPEIQAAFFDSLKLAQRIYTQQPKDKNKVYSVHAPEVECIGKGKAHKKYEFGNKVGFVTTSREGFVIGAKGFHGNPYDGHTLSISIEQAEQIVGQELNGDVFVDKGYKGHRFEGEATIHMAGQKGRTASMKKWMRRRSAIEPRIGHMKNNGRLGRNYLKGKEGDQINPILCVCGMNLRLILLKIRQQVAFSLVLFWKRVSHYLHSQHFYFGKFCS